MSTTPTSSQDRAIVKKSIKIPRKARSVNGKAVADDVIAHLRNGKKVNMQRIQKAHGYSDTSAKAMMATRTKSYKETIFDYVKSMESLRDKTIKALHSHDLTKAKLFDLNLLLKNLNHDIQLIRGKATENITTRASVVVYGSDDFLAMQLNDGSVKP